MSSRYLAANGATGDAYVYKLLGTGSTGINEIYIHADVYTCVQEFTNFSGDYFDAIDLYGDGGLSFPYTGNFSNGDPGGPFTDNGDWVDETLDDFIGAPVLLGANSIDLHMKISTSTLLYIINGTTYDLSAAGVFSGWINRFNVFTVGSLYAGTLNFATNVTAGTSGFGSTDIISDDFSSGTFAAWDGTRGDVSITATIANPCTLLPSTIVFDGQQAFQVA